MESWRRRSTDAMLWSGGPWVARGRESLDTDFTPADQQPHTEAEPGPSLHGCLVWPSPGSLRGLRVSRVLPGLPAAQGLAKSLHLNTLCLPQGFLGSPVLCQLLPSPREPLSAWQAPQLQRGPKKPVPKSPWGHSFHAGRARHRAGPQHTR